MIRFFDIIFVLLAILLLLPLLLPVIVILRLSGEGKILFLQDRVGKRGKFFKLIKFATMLENSPNMGSGTITMKDDGRILPFGVFLRKTKINELPQLFNILLGDMSLVGPRPLTKQTFTSYSDSTQKIITQIRPGLSGIGSIIFRGEEGIMQGPFASVDFYHQTIAPYKGRLEEWYISNRSLSLYFMVILLTVWVVLVPSSKIIWRLYKDLPVPPKDLVVLLNSN
jgi:lipopolysaccharide/colanic/teichoic acid biosynthesis glycosyltransferase